MLIRHVRNVYLGRRNFHYLLAGLVLDEGGWEDVPELSAGMLSNNIYYLYKILYYTLWYQSFLNPNASSADDTMPKSLLKHLSTTFVTAKTYNISLQKSLNSTDLPLVAIC